MMLFSNPQNYREMLNKISMLIFVVIMIILIIISSISIEFEAFMFKISLGIKYELFNLNLYISYFYIPLIFSIIENIFQVHNIISNIFKIRYNFDIKVIIKLFYQKCNIKFNYNDFNNETREKIMSNVFYKYASSTSPKIDAHLIYMALGIWCWYWTFVDTLLVVIILGMIFLIINFSWRALITLIVIILISLLLMWLIKKFRCEKFAKQEVKTILEDESRKYEITEFLKNIKEN